MSAVSPQLPDVSTWQTQVIRLTGYLADTLDISQLQWWQMVTGDIAEESITKKGGVRIDEGRYEAGRLRLQIDPLRVDWRLTAAVDPGEMFAEGLPTLGSFPDVLAHFSKLMTKWIPSCPAIKRLAFGAVLLHPCENREASYQLLDAYLPDVRVSSQSFDFTYKVNRKRPSNVVEGLKINRLNSWSALHWMMSVSLSQAQGATTRDLRPLEGDACQLELDINTDAEFQGELPMNRIVETWQELLQLGTEIAEQGDVP